MLFTSPSPVSDFLSLADNSMSLERVRPNVIHHLKACGSSLAPSPESAAQAETESSTHLNDRPNTGPTQDGHLPCVDAVRSVFTRVIHPEYSTHRRPTDAV